jgi:hypothetical protein
MSTALTNFVTSVRVLIGDNHPDILVRDDTQIIAALATVVNLGKVSGDQTEVPFYTLDTLGTSITPDLTPASDLRAYCQLIYHTAFIFAADVTPTHWHTRAFSETVGRNDDRAFNLMQEIYHTDNPWAAGASDYE